MLHLYTHPYIRPYHDSDVRYWQGEGFLYQVSNLFSDIGVNILTASDVKTQSLQVGKQIFTRHFKTPNGDIAYHFELGDEDITFEEGEIIGLVTSKDGNQQTVRKLNLHNCSDAQIKGVVTRSQYFEARKPKGMDNIFSNFFFNSLAARKITYDGQSKV